MTILVGSLVKPYAQWQTATWQDYERLRDDPSLERVQLFYYNHQLLVENMGWEGILHSEVRELLGLILGLWLMQHPEIKSKILGSCLMEKVGQQAAAPDILVYLGENLPQYQKGESRRINLEQQRSPDLVIEVADTTLDSDLDQKKHLYAALGISEYWVIDAQGSQVFIFILSNQEYYRNEVSQLISGFTEQLLSEAIDQMKLGSNISAASWFSQQLLHSLSKEES
ncbi:Uma2 family endonuclease [Synechococcus sp. C9]|jgi:Uma2 family endonuclease|uniref:Uma2 family endonuclease n=1 Tax=Synechococcus sp. C9 TaxID=102119 RepID=UPI001FF3319B|nr:Uma2 family endonuclease [Synechococcus sp. C9]